MRKTLQTQINIRGAGERAEFQPLSHVVLLSFFVLSQPLSHVVLLSFFVLSSLKCFVYYFSTANHTYCAKSPYCAEASLFLN